MVWKGFGPTGRSCIIAKHYALVLAGKPLHHRQHRSFIGVKFARISNLAIPSAIRDTNRVAQLRHIDPDADVFIILLGWSSCDEGRPGQSEQPSTPQFIPRSTTKGPPIGGPFVNNRAATEVTCFYTATLA